MNPGALCLTSPSGVHGWPVRPAPCRRGRVTTRVATFRSALPPARNAGISATETRPDVATLTKRQLLNFAGSLLLSAPLLQPNVAVASPLKVLVVGENETTRTHHQH